MNGKHGLVGIVESVDAPTEVHTEGHMVADAPAVVTFRLRQQEGSEGPYEIPRDRYFALHTRILQSREGSPDKPVYVELENERVSRILIPQLRRVAQVLEGPVSVKVRVEGSPTKFVLARDRHDLTERLKEAVQSQAQVLITDDPDTHEILDVSPPFEVPEREALPTEPLNKSEPLSLEEAMEAFKLLAEDPKIHFEYVDDCCTVRAHQMFRRLREKFPCQKIWSYGGSGDPRHGALRFFTLSHPDGLVSWYFHVALLIKARLKNGVPVDLVLDPALFNRPVRIADWLALQHDTMAVWEVTPPEVYIQWLGGAKSERDDNFERTVRDLERHGFESQRRRLSLLPAGSAESSETPL